MKQILSRGVFFIISLFLTNPYSLFAFEVPSGTDTRSFALGNVHALSKELINPASISFETCGKGGIFVYNRFQMKELNTSGGYAILPNSVLDIGVKFSGYGYEDYHTWELRTCVSKKVTSGIALGSYFLYAGESLAGEEKNRSYIAAGIGLNIHTGEKFEFALLADNLINDLPEKSSLLHAGINYQIIRNWYFLLETVTNWNDFFNLSAGFEYLLSEQMTIRCGIRTHPKSPSFGMAYNWKKWSVDIGFSFHNTLGTSSSISLSLLF